MPLEEMSDAACHETAPCFGGTIHLLSLPIGTLPLRITATNTDGAVSRATVSVNHQPVTAPWVTSPRQGEPVADFLRITASCPEDPKGCAHIAASLERSISYWGGTDWSEPLISKDAPRVDLEVPISPLRGHELLKVDLTDHSNQLRSYFIRLHPRPSDELVEIESVPGKVLDTTSERILYWESPSMGSPGKVIVKDRTTGQVEVLALNLRAQSGFLIRGGAIILDQDTNLIECRDSSCAPIAQVGFTWNLAVEGDHVAWGQDGALYYRNIEQGVTKQISTSTGRWALGDNGDLVFLDEAAGLLRYRNGVLTRLLDLDHARKYGWALATSGGAVAARSYDGQVLLISETKAAVFLPSNPVDNDTVRYFVAGHGYLALAMSSGRILVRSPDGTMSERPPAPLFSGLLLNLVGPNGELVYSTWSTGQRSTLSFPDGKTIDLGPTPSLDGKWTFDIDRPRLILGNTIFGIRALEEPAPAARAESPGLGCTVTPVRPTRQLPLFLLAAALVRATRRRTK
ncbi:MAG: hypothetical protein HY698_16860 [Deltaproteobacteria bacterium]|nr:hypothetical protein [Deltaproteobacteria bacterium]